MADRIPVPDIPEWLEKQLALLNIEDVGPWLVGEVLDRHKQLHALRAHIKSLRELCRNCGGTANNCKVCEVRDGQYAPDPGCRHG
jgi:hypothetical protein